MVKKQVHDLMERMVQDPTTGCWLWEGPSKPPRGYAIYNCRKGGKNAPQYVHRLSYEMHFGKIPKDRIVMHTCDNRICFRPEHLRLGTPADNSADMAAKKRSTFGARNPMAKLTDKDVLDIRASQLSGYQIAKNYGLSQTTIYGILQRKRWKHLP
jgi:hypothetical protein